MTRLPLILALMAVGCDRPEPEKTPAWVTAELDAIDRQYASVPLDKDPRFTPEMQAKQKRWREDNRKRGHAISFKEWRMTSEQTDDRWLCEDGSDVRPLNDDPKFDGCP